MWIARTGIIAGKGVLSTLNTGIISAYNAENTTNDSLTINNGTAVGGLTYTTGKIGDAFSFNGTTSYVNMGDVMDVGTGSWTYSCWFNTNDSTTGTIFSKAIAAFSVGRVWGGLYNNKLTFNFHAVGNVIYTEANTTISTNTWYHAIFMIDRTNNLRIYINGVFQTLTTTGGTNNIVGDTTNYNTNHPFRVGSYTAADNTSSSTLFNGEIDAFNVWNRLLTNPEIAELYNSGIGKQYPY